MTAGRYSSKDYRTFNDHVWANNKNSYQRDDDDVYDVADYYQNDFGRKNSVSLAVNQALPAGWGSLSGSALWRDYWQRGGTRNDFQLSYSKSWSRVTYTLSASQASGSIQGSVVAWAAGLISPIHSPRPLPLLMRRGWRVRPCREIDTTPPAAKGKQSIAA